MGNDRSVVPIAVAESQACKLQQQVQLQMQDPNLEKLKQTRESNKQQTSEKAPTGPTAAAGPQLCKVEANNNKQHLANQRTNEQATTSEPMKNVCILNDDYIAFQIQNRYETYDVEATPSL